MCVNEQKLTIYLVFHSLRIILETGILISLMSATKITKITQLLQLIGSKYLLILINYFQFSCCYILMLRCPLYRNTETFPNFATHGPLFRLAAVCFIGLTLLKISHHEYKAIGKLSFIIEIGTKPH